MNAPQLLNTKAATYAVLGIVGLVALWWVLRKGKEVAQAAAGTVASPIAEVIIAARGLDQPSSTSARVRLPSGALVDPARGEFLSVGNGTAQWRYNGVTYRLGPRDASGIYPAFAPNTLDYQL